MRHVKEVLRQKVVLGRSHRQIAASLGVSAGVVGETASRAKKRGLLDWSAVEGLDEAELERRLYGGHAGAAIQRVLPDPAYLDVELVLDDFALSPMDDHEKQDLLEVLEDRYGTGSAILTSQLSPNRWHEYIDDPTLADAICDRLIHSAHKIALKGPSRRKEKALSKWKNTPASLRSDHNQRNP
jgi:hypothetical protein